MNTTEEVAGQIVENLRNVTDDVSTNAGTIAQQLDDARSMLAEFTLEILDVKPNFELYSSKVI